MREDNGLYVTCTVANSEYAPKHHILKACDENILCTKSEKFTVVYPVSNDSIRIETAEGGDKLVCHAPGVPAPVFEWASQDAVLPEQGDTLDLRMLNSSEKSFAYL
ncbi:hypothetical protein ElyMa_003675700 [Elysia marginata]|uniref:Ig-like domain-containing protein n=1 Tax=Elysia marginata TaxID=1093978 RepID=A0AAV4EZI4_9GAST|nr:hypothetical protein ElyMa_003675700 [Elysia marginata]